MRSATAIALVRMGGRACAIPCEHIVEVVPRVQLGVLPDAPATVLGVLNLRGRVVPVLDQRLRVAGANATLPAYQHLVIVEARGRHVGLAVDEVYDVCDVPSKEIERLGNPEGNSGPGIVRIGDELILILAPEQMVHGTP